MPDSSTLAQNKTLIHNTNNSLPSRATHIHNTYKIVALTPLQVRTPPRSLYWDFQDDLKEEKLTTKGLYGVLESKPRFADVTRVCSGFVEFLSSIWHGKTCEEGRYGRESGGNIVSTSTEGIELHGLGEITISDPSPRAPEDGKTGRRRKKLAVGAGERGG